MEKKRRIEDYKVGDDMVLSTTNLSTYCPYILQKIKERWIGPLRMTKEVSPVAFGLDLSLGWQIHLVFHVSKLKCYFHSEDFYGRLSHPSNTSGRYFGV